MRPIGIAADRLMNAHQNVKAAYASALEMILLVSLICRKHAKEAQERIFVIERPQLLQGEDFPT